MSDDLSPLPDTPTGIYRHYKGAHYRVLGVVRHSETLEPFVLYRPLDSDVGDWVRPYTMFFEVGVFDGVQRARFTRISD